MAKYHGRAVAGNFNDIVSGVGVRLGEESGNDLVDAVAGDGIDQLTEMGAFGLQGIRVRQTQHRLGNLGGLGAGEPYHADAAAAGGRSDGNDGVVEGHGSVASG
jgi:hypothetical protein